MRDRRAVAPNSDRSRRARLRAWTLASALFGLLSMGAPLASHWYFNEALGYRAGRLLLWLLPSWYAGLAIQAAGLPGSAATWTAISLMTIASAAFGATIGFACASVAGLLRRMLGSRGRDR